MNLNNSQSAGNVYANLSFTALRVAGGVDLWNPPEIDGSWAKQCRAGRQLGDEACDHVSATGNVPLLPSIVRAIVERGIFGGVEVGFFSAVSERLLTG